MPKASKGPGPKCPKCKKTGRTLSKNGKKSNNFCPNCNKKWTT